MSREANPAVPDAAEPIWDPAVRAYGPRRAARELLRAQLEADALRGRAATPTFRARLRVARELGLSATLLQQITGVARQTIYQAARRPIGGELDELVLLALIAAAAVPTVATLAAATGIAPERIEPAVVRLHASGYVNTLNRVFSLTEKGLERIQIEIGGERLRSTHTDAWTVFLAIDEPYQDEILATAKHVLETDDCARVIHAALASSRTRGSELAVVVHAADSRRALRLAHGLWKRLRQDLSRLPSNARVVAVAPPQS